MIAHEEEDEKKNKIKKTAAKKNNNKQRKYNKQKRTVSMNETSVHKTVSKNVYTLHMGFSHPLPACKKMPAESRKNARCQAVKDKGFG